MAHPVSFVLFTALGASCASVRAPLSNPIEVMGVYHFQEGWLGPYMATYYGEGDSVLWPYVCSYNIERGNIASGDCNMIRLGERIQLPPVRTLRCMFVTSFGETCPPTTLASTSAARALAKSLPLRAIWCAETMLARNPGWDPTYAIGITMAFKTTFGINTPEFEAACLTQFGTTDLPLRPTELDYLTVDPDGSVVLVDHLGSEDAY